MNQEQTDTSPSYVILTGSKNNAGDFLIKYRAKRLFSWLRPDRQIIDLDGWKPFDSESLATVNNAKALILMGGPALQEKMRPNIYGLSDNLSDIKAPIATMGIGWYSQQGYWQNTHNYPMSGKSVELLDRIASDKLQSSVRDYHTLNTLNSMGYENYLMTGCPAYYDQEFLNHPIKIESSPKKVGFSLGVSFKNSSRMFKQMQQAVLKTQEVLPDSCQLEVAFHHSLNESYLQAHGGMRRLFEKQREFANWLDSEKIPYVDISGSAENLINYYSNCDLHVGYRVHAHIFMSSISKPSIILSEDGRGIGLKEVIGGVGLRAFSRSYKNLFISACHRFGIPFDDFKPAENFIADYQSALKYEMKHGVRLQQTKTNIQQHFTVMESFIKGLP